jgi:hypothetical protein
MKRKRIDKVMINESASGEYLTKTLLKNEKEKRNENVNMK